LPQPPIKEKPNRGNVRFFTLASPVQEEHWRYIMRARLLAGISATLLVLGPCFAAVQDDSAAQEAKRQSVAANSKTDSSPPQTMRQAIAFERYKDLAAEREARKEAGQSRVTNNTADRSKDDAAPVRKKTKK
jgi:hypothetical protein